MLNLNEKYTELNTNFDIKIDCEELLSFFPDYYKEKVRLENESTVYLNYDYFYTSYYDEIKKTSEYQRIKKELKKNGMAKNRLSSALLEYVDSKRQLMVNNIRDSRIAAVRILDLIDYVGHYKRGQKKDYEYEELLKKYDIRIIDGHKSKNLQISANDAVRLINTAKDKISCHDAFYEDIFDQEKVLSIMEKSPQELDTYTQITKFFMDSFPTSIRNWLKEKKEAKLEEKYQRIKNRYFG